MYALRMCIRLAKMGFRQKRRLKAPQNKTKHTAQHPTVNYECERDRTLSIKPRLNLQKSKKQMVKKMKLKALQYRVLRTIKFNMPPPPPPPSPPRYIYICAKPIEEKYNDLLSKMGKMNKKQHRLACTSTHMNTYRYNM